MNDALLEGTRLSALRDETYFVPALTLVQMIDDVHEIAAFEVQVVSVVAACRIDSSLNLRREKGDSL